MTGGNWERRHHPNHFRADEPTVPHSAGTAGHLWVRMLAGVSLLRINLIQFAHYVKQVFLIMKRKDRSTHCTV